MNTTLVLLIWEALKACGMDTIGAWAEPDWMPFIREQESL